MSTVATTNLKNPNSVSNNIVLNSNGTTTISSPSITTATATTANITTANITTANITTATTTTDNITTANITTANITTATTTTDNITTANITTANITTENTTTANVTTANITTANVTTLADSLGANTSTPAAIAAGIAKAWVNFDGTGPVPIRASYNVSSITDNGTGDYTVNFTTAMPDANYSMTLNASNSASNSVTIAFLRWIATAPTASAARIGTTNDAGTSIDMPNVCVAIFR